MHIHVGILWNKQGKPSYLNELVVSALKAACKQINKAFTVQYSILYV